MFQDQARFRRHKGACPYYRENWLQDDQRTPEGEIILYEVYCLKGWPPETQKDQAACMVASRFCWRNQEDHRITPEESAARRAARSA